MEYIRDHIVRHALLAFEVCDMSVPPVEIDPPPGFLVLADESLAPEEQHTVQNQRAEQGQPQPYVLSPESVAKVILVDPAPVLSTTLISTD
jgi:hypothetical protein